MIKKVNHVSITVKDLDKVVAFFRDTLGLTDVQPTYERVGQEVETVIGMPGAHLKITKIAVEGCMLEFIQYLSPPGREPKLNTNDIGCPHIGFEVDDLEETYRTLTEKGVRFKSPPVWKKEPGPNPGWGVVYLWGPEDITLEFAQRPK
jgi:catechol 2,3-dioxygenase-like lactoylglutathione lyase family enzyme